MNSSGNTNPPVSTVEKPPEAEAKRRRWLWLVLLALAGAAICLLATRKKTPQATIEKEAHRILTFVRNRDGRSSLTYSVLDAMQNWPKPFPWVAERLLGSGSDDLDPAQSLASLGPLVIPVLTNSLSGDRSVAVRATSAEALGQMQDTHLVPPLLAAFKSERDISVQSSILAALGGLEDERAEPLLASVLRGTNDPQVRISAAHALGQFQSAHALRTLTNALATDGDNSVRQSLLRVGLAWTANPEAKPALLAALQSDQAAQVRGHAAQELRNHPSDDTVTALITALRQDTDASNVRVAAVGALGEMTNRMVYPALLEALRQDSPDVRAAVARAFVNFPGAESESILLETLTSDSAPIVRASAASALERLADTQTNQTLLNGLIQSLQRDRDLEVRAASASALARIGGEQVVLALRTSLETERNGRVQVEAIGGVYRHSNSNTAALLLQLLDNSNLEPEAVSEAVRCLGLAHAQQATPKLRLLLTSSPEEEVRRSAASALGALDNSNAVATLTEALSKEDSSSVRSEIAEALGRMASARTPAVVAALIDALKHEPEASTRPSVVAALGSLRDPAALPILIKTLGHDSDGDARANAATALGKLGHPKAIPPLETALQRDRDRDVRANAASSLHTLAGAKHAQFFLNAFDADPSIRPQLAAILGLIASPEAVTALLNCLQTVTWAARTAVIQALGDAGDSRATSALIQILDQDANVTSRTAAATALGQLCDPAALPALQRALEDRIVSVRQEAAWALGHIGDTNAAPALSKALNDANSEVRFAASFALAETGARGAAPGLVSVLSHSDERTQLAAASALAFLDQTEGISVLRVNLDSTDVWKRFTALISLLRLDTPETRQLLAGCHDKDSTLAATIEAGLRLGGPGAATNMLCSARDNDSMTEDFRHFGARALVLFNDPRGLPALKSNENDPREGVRSAVRIAIRRLEKRSAE